MNRLTITGLLLLLIISSGCEAVGTIFKGGMWFGIILVVGIVVAVIALLSRFRK